MCTVSLIAVDHGGYLLAANRDEHVTRGVARPPEHGAAGATRFVAPRDADAGGTWIAVDDEGRSVCLLNGDRPVAGYFAPDDVRSRGELVIELLRDPRPAAVAESLRERAASGKLDVRPFKIVAAAPIADHEEIEAIRADFDGASLAVASITAPHLETSNGFDPSGAAKARQAAFRRLLERLPSAAARGADPLRAELLAFHASHAPGAVGEERRGALSVCVHRPEVRTVSTTLIEVRRERIVMRYQPGSPCEGNPAIEITP
jgi:transport and Golgi organization protein 2